MTARVMAVPSLPTAADVESLRIKASVALLAREHKFMEGGAILLLFVWLCGCCPR